MTPEQRRALQRNSRNNLRTTLEQLASADLQRRYKAAVPFVHVPEELLEQWAHYRRLLREGTEWFVSDLAPDELQAMTTFDAEALRRMRGRRSLPDVPVALDDAAWQAIMAAARELLVALAPAPAP
ncbi:hypothetical protein [Nannocystis radixulma]|uniref:Uncharacterized protein n=1 Tax=Nannocystis radixulma TaxID=2995305 RepID=A0ABT5BFM3_9BACT|nr:hypothetical protein [Nannocystis radixulma]MDC0672882.1 hypothetical protein [Nannocystis radixulma]